MGLLDGTGIPKRCICLMSSDFKHKIFVVPESKDDKEKSEILADQIHAWLIALSNQTGKYQLAIDIVQGYLNTLVSSLPDDMHGGACGIGARIVNATGFKRAVIASDSAPRWVRDAATLAGRRFLIDVSDAKGFAFRKAIENGELPFSIKSIGRSRPHIDAGNSGDTGNSGDNHEVGGNNGGSADQHSSID